MFLDCYHNEMTSMDVSQNPELKQFRCDSNKIYNLNLNNNPALESLNCNQTQLISLDLSNNPGIKRLDCAGTELTNLDISRNTLLLYFDARNNPGLSCIKVFDSSQAMINQFWYKDISAVYSRDCSFVKFLEMTYIPDDNFEKVLTDLGYEIGTPNDSIPTKNLETVTSLDISDKNIFDLTGIEDFKSLIELDCSGNPISSIDISKNIKLEILNCYNNFNLESLDISKNIALVKLDCSQNKLMSLDVSENTALEELYCFGNYTLTSLDVSENKALEVLDCYYNELTSLDIGENIALIKLDCSHNQILRLDAGQNTALEEMNCSFNLLTDLEMSNYPALKWFYCSSNQLKNLDASQNLTLEGLLCAENQLTILDLSKNNNLDRLDALNNPNLSCIQVVDSAKAANNSNWYKDEWAVYSEDCSGVDVDEEIDVSHDILLSPNPASDYIEINVGNRHAFSQQEDLKIYNALGECVMNLTPALSEGEGARFDISGLATGMYFVRLGDRVSKFIKAL
jgi:hypothetical protein